MGLADDHLSDELAKSHLPMSKLAHRGPIWSLIPSKPLPDARNDPREVELDVLDVVQDLCRRIGHLDRDHFTVQLALVDQ